MSKEVNLLEGSIAKGLAKLAFPLMGMSLIQMAYNLTDMIWIGRLGSGAVASVGTVGMFTWLGMGLNMIAQLGGQVLVGQKTGAKDYNKVKEYAKGAMQLGFIVSFIYACIMIFKADALIGFFNLSSKQIVKDAKVYMIAVAFGVVFNNLGKIMTALITTTGNSKTPFVATTIGLVINIILDPLLIFGLGPIPKMGVLGAGIATVVAQIIVFGLLFAYMLTHTGVFKGINFFKPCRLKHIKEIAILSLPVMLQNILFPAITMIISRLVVSFGDDAIAVQRIGSQIESISWMTADGFGIALNSFIAQNYGANNMTRAKKGYKTASIIMGMWGVMATLILILGARPVFSIFINDEKVIEMGITYLIILGCSQLFMCIEIMTTGAFNGLGRTKIPAITNIIFTGLRIPMAMILSATALGLSGIWWSISISSILKGIILWGMFRVAIRKY